MNSINTVVKQAKNRRHRRKINTGEKAKVVAAVLGTEFIQFLAALAILHKGLF